MSNPFKTVNVTPSYADGFTFTWAMSGSFKDALPWVFKLQLGDSIDGPWTDLSNTGVTNQFLWTYTPVSTVNKDRVLYFRVKLVTGTTPNTETYYSHVISPYTRLTRREWLIARDIMRREILHARTMAGTPGKLWIRSTFGVKCVKCSDPVTNDQLLGENCEFCFGTGRNPGYFGPHDMWFTFTPHGSKTEMSGDGNGMRQPYTYKVRAVGVPLINTGDVIVDTHSDKRYAVDFVDSTFEVRRFTCLQMLTVKEIPASSAIYKLNANLTPADSCLPELS